jgi:molecular chaperone GrpE
MEEENKKENQGSGDEIADLREKLGQAEKQRDEYLSGWQRTKADFINFKRDEMARLEQAVKYGSEEFMREMIRVLDSFDLGLAALEKQGPVEKGVYMIRAQVEDALKRFGLERIIIKPGDPYDPALAESIIEEESDGPECAVLEEIEPGYRLHQKIVRPARVKISKKKENK